MSLSPIEQKEDKTLNPSHLDLVLRINLLLSKKISLKIAVIKKDKGGENKNITIIITKCMKEVRLRMKNLKILPPKLKILMPKECRRKILRRMLMLRIKELIRGRRKAIKNKQWIRMWFRERGKRSSRKSNHSLPIQKVKFMPKSKKIRRVYRMIAMMHRVINTTLSLRAKLKRLKTKE